MLFVNSKIPEIVNNCFLVKGIIVPLSPLLILSQSIKSIDWPLSHFASVMLVTDFQRKTRKKNRNLDNEYFVTVFFLIFFFLCVYGGGGGFLVCEVKV